jgi:nucleoside-diphosphate-sugar epimerase
VIHLAAAVDLSGSWDEILEANVVGTYNVLQAAAEAEVEDVIFASSIHTVGMYEEENAPAVYDRDSGVLVDHESEVRPDSYYGASKAFGEDLGRYYVERRNGPQRFYALRIASVREAEYDHPYGDAERGVEEGEFDRESEAYERQVRRLSATWQSRRDLAQEVECCLRDETVTFDVFYGVSDNETAFFDIEHAREVLGYDPVDDSAAWDGPPQR